MAGIPRSEESVMRLRSIAFCSIFYTSPALGRDIDTVYFGSPEWCYTRVTGPASGICLHELDSYVPRFRRPHRLARGKRVISDECGESGGTIGYSKCLSNVIRSAEFKKQVGCRGWPSSTCRAFREANRHQEGVTVELVARWYGTGEESTLEPSEGPTKDSIR